MISFWALPYVVSAHLKYTSPNQVPAIDSAVSLSLLQRNCLPKIPASLDKSGFLVKTVFDSLIATVENITNVKSYLALITNWSYVPA